MRTLRLCALLSALVLGAALPAAAQSLFATGGLGLPAQPLDARARALGGGVGLFGLNASMVNPAEAAGLVQKGFSGTMQPVSRDVTLGGVESSLGGTRFPLMRLFYPLGERTVLSLGYGSFLEQSWSVRSETTVQFGGRAVRASDLHDSEGGIAQVRLGAAYTLGPTLVLGGAVGLYTGELQRSVTRTFPDSEDLEVRPFSQSSRWSYGAPLAAIGVRWDPAPVARVGASLAWSGELEAEPQVEGPEHRFGLPLRLDVGATGALAPRLSLSVSGAWANWGSAASGVELPPIAGDVEVRTLRAEDTWELGGGVEWTGIRSEGRTFPVRLGYRTARQPFPLAPVAGAAAEAPREWYAALGMGVRMREEETGPSALIDATLERGALSGATAAGDLREGFWRMSVSLALFGR